MEFSGFIIDETDQGLKIELTSMSQVHVLLRICLFAKFPRDYQFDSIPLLSPFVSQLVRACHERIQKDPVERIATALNSSPWPVFRQSDEFTRAVMKCIDEYIDQIGRENVTEAERERLIRIAIEPHTVEGFD